MKRSMILATSISIVLGGCLGGPGTPAAVAPSLDGWRGIGLTCTGPTEDNVPSGLLQWSCRGMLRSATLFATLDGDDAGVFTILAALPAGTGRETVVGAFGDLVDATPALASADGGIRPWLEAQQGPASYWESGLVAEFGSARVMLRAEDPWITLNISPGPRRSVEAAPS
jgi:hypothetical protein